MEASSAVRKSVAYKCGVGGSTSDCVTYLHHGAESFLRS